MNSESRAKLKIRAGPAGVVALNLLARCPRMPADAMQVFLGHRHAVTTAQLLARLHKARLATYKVYRLGPLLGSRPVRLWTLTDSGRSFLSSRNLSAVENSFGAAYGEPERRRDPARQGDIP